MPRPQRKKVAPLTSIATTAPMKKATDVTKGTQNKRITRISASNKAKSSSDSDILGPQDDSSDNPDLLMTGALHKGDAPAKSTRKSSRNTAKTSGIYGSHEQSSDNNGRRKQRQATRQTDALAISSTTGAVIMDDAPLDEARGATPTHATQSSRQKRNTPPADATALDALSDIDLDNDSLQVQQPAQLQPGLNSRRTSVQRPASVLRVFGTPAMDTSVLALTRFKRRKRQGSIVGRMQRASVLSSSQMGNLELESQLDQTNLDLDDFNPDDESTPLHGTIIKDNTHTTSSRKRRYDGSPIDHSRSLVPQSSSPLSSGHRHSMSDELPEPESKIDVVPESAPPTQTGTVPAQVDDDEDITSTMAPPLSSSVLEPSSPSADVDVVHSTRHRDVHMSTIELTSLLPKTRNRRPQRRGARSVFELHGSNTDITSDDIELETQELESPDVSENDEADPSFASVRQTRSTRIKQASKVAANRKNARGRKPLDATTNAKTASKEVVTSKSKRKSYRKDVEVEKENEEDVSYAAEHDVLDDTIVIETAKTMKKIKEKFAEIDQFEMSFETVDTGGENSLWR